MTACVISKGRPRGARYPRRLLEPYGGRLGTRISILEGGSWLLIIVGFWGSVEVSEAPGWGAKVGGPGAKATV